MQKLLPTLLIYVGLFFILSTVLKVFLNDIPLAIALQASVIPTVIYAGLMGLWLMYKLKKQNRL